MSWQKVKLGSILTESKVISENPDTNKRIKVRLKVLGVEKRGVENEVEGATKQFIRRAGQFIFGKQNFHKGAFGIIPDELDGFESSSDLPAFDIDKSCLPDFLFYFFKQGNYYLELSKIAYGVATQRINMKEFYELEIPLPDIETQIQIINQFKTLENSGGEINNELTYQLDLIKQLRQAFLREAMQGKLLTPVTSSGVEKQETGHDLLAKIKAEKAQLIAENLPAGKAGKLKKEKELPPITADEIPFEIPEHWAWCRLGEISNIQRGSSPRPKGDSRYFAKSQTSYNWITISDISSFCEGNKLKQTREYLTEEGSKHSRFVDKNEFIIAVSGSTTGKCCLTGIDGFIYDGLAVIKQINSNLPSEFLMNYMTYLYAHINNSKSGASFPNINTDFLNNLIYPLPPLHEQEQIVAKLEELMAFCDGLEQSITESQGYNEKLLQQVLREALQPKEEVANE